MKIRVGIDVACRAAHQASCADELGVFAWSGHRFRTDPADLELLWAKLPSRGRRSDGDHRTDPERWVPLAAWFRRRGATVVVVPPEQSADLRDYYNKHAKSDRLDSKILARLPLLHPEGLHVEDTIGPGDPLKRAVKIRSGLVHRRTTSMQRLDCLVELMGPAWIAALGSDMTLLPSGSWPATPTRTPCAASGIAVSASSCIAPAEGRGPPSGPPRSSTPRPPPSRCGVDEFDFDELAADIAAEARLALSLCDEIHTLDRRIAKLYTAVDPAGVVRSAPGVGIVGAPQILGRLGDATRFRNLAAVRSFSGLVPRQNDSGVGANAGGPTKSGDACLREALFNAADHARKIDPTLAARYHRLMTAEGKHHTSALCTVSTVLLTRSPPAYEPDTPTSSAMSMARHHRGRRPPNLHRALHDPHCHPRRRVDP